MESMKPMQPMQPMEFKKGTRWWPEDLGQPNSSGSQNDVDYAYFRASRRLLLRCGDEISTYDTGSHDIQGVSQASDTVHAKFTTNQGALDLSQLKRL